MKKILSALFLLGAGFNLAKAQCSACTPVDCSATLPTGGLCNYLHDDTAGKPYEDVISFYMPDNLSDPVTLSKCGGCSSVSLRQIDVVGIQGLPPGLTYSISQNGSYNVQGGDHFGCVHFCGTPVAPGTYYMVVNLLADVTAHGTPLGDVQANDQAQQYRDTLIIYPGVSECPGTFTLGNGPCITKACDSVSVNLSGSLSNPDCSNLISYDWSFGNGQTSKVKSPGIVNYNLPDTFPLTLTTTYYTYRIKSVTVNVSGGYTGDIEELTSASKPDPYIRINSLAFNNRGSSSDVNSVTFSNLNLVIPGSNCADPIEIQVWDEDTGPPQGINPFGSQDDHINDHYITPAIPNQVTSFLNNSTIAVTFDTVATSSVTESIDIVVYPHPPTPVLISSVDSICGGDSVLISFTPALNNYLYHWYLNDTTELLTYDSVLYAKAEGNYTLKVTNMETGCEEFSQPKFIGVGQPSPHQVDIVYNGTQLFVSPFPSTGFAVEWYYNGNLVTGQSGKFLPYLGNGVYDAQLYNINYPGCRTVANPDTLDISGLEVLNYNPVQGVSIYPNPNNGRFTLKFTSDNFSDIKISIRNTMGQIVREESLSAFEGNYQKDFDMTDFGKGIYIATIESSGVAINKKMVVQ